ncbi:MAG: hypothetical protein GF353_09780 [Candidatus Lokiarchaeota archaeon]|nr:hypothetical protein [Candidatus Lokiarchaeota archaeon]
MKGSKLRILTVSIIAFIILLSIIPFVLGKPRKTYITDFVLDHEEEDEGFVNCNREEDRVSNQATAYGLEILDDFDLLVKKDIFGTVEKTVNSSDLVEELEDKIISLSALDTTSLSDIYFLCQALTVLDEEIEDNAFLSAKGFVDSKQDVGGGFASRDDGLPNLISTCLALNIYEMIDETIPNIESHKSFILSCANSDGGYGGNSSLSSTILNTFYVALTTEVLDDSSFLFSGGATIDYLNSFFVDDENDVDNYGGYLPSVDSKYATLGSTYYCISAIYLLDEDEVEDEDATTEWILARQNFQDGGFVDKTDGYNQKYSSLVNTYYAYSVLKLFDKELLTLEEEIFEVEFNWWILVILLSVIGAIVVIGIIVWRKRRF